MYWIRLRFGIPMTPQEDPKESPGRDVLAMPRTPIGNHQCAMCPMEEVLLIPETHLVALLAGESLQTAWSQTARQILEAQALLRLSERRQEYLLEVLEVPEAQEVLPVQEAKCELVRPPAPPDRHHKAQLRLSQVTHLP